MVKCAPESQSSKEPKAADPKESQSSKEPKAADPNVVTTGFVGPSGITFSGASDPLDIKAATMVGQYVNDGKSIAADCIQPKGYCPYQIGAYIVGVQVMYLDRS